MLHVFELNVKNPAFAQQKNNSVLNINIKKLTFARHDTNTNASLNYEDLLENQNLWGLFSKIIYSIVRKITSSEWL